MKTLTEAQAWRYIAENFGSVDQRSLCAEVHALGPVDAAAADFPHRRGMGLYGVSAKEFKGLITEATRRAMARRIQTHLELMNQSEYGDARVSVWLCPENDDGVRVSAALLLALEAEDEACA